MYCFPQTKIIIHNDYDAIFPNYVKAHKKMQKKSHKYLIPFKKKT